MQVDVDRWQLTGSLLVAYYILSYWQLSGSSRAAHWKFTGSVLAAYGQLNGSLLAAHWQLIGSSLAAPASKMMKIIIVISIIAIWLQSILF